MEEKFKITFNVSVFSTLGHLVKKFTVQAETKKDAHYLVIQQLKSEGIYENVNYKIT